MAVPAELRPRLERAADAIRAVVDAVHNARYDQRTDEPNSGLSVAEALAQVTVACDRWGAISDDIEDALEVALEQHPDAESELRACQSALLLLNVGVTSEVALVQPLDLIDDSERIADIPNWPAPGEATLDDAAMGRGDLLTLLHAGTDDDTERDRSRGFGLTESLVYDTTSTIVYQSADAFRSVVTGLAAVPVMGFVPLPVGMTEDEVVKALLEQSTEMSIDAALDKLPGRVSRIVRAMLTRARRLLAKLIGGSRDEIVTASHHLLASGARKADAPRTLIAKALAHVLTMGNVVDRGDLAIAQATSKEIAKRRRRLEKLEKSNNRWVKTPIEVLAHGLSPLWAVPIPLGVVAVPAAPVAAVVLFAWVVLISADQLDSAGHFPDFWKGVVRRAQGE